MNGDLLLNAHEESIVRAVCDSADTWTVERVSLGRRATCLAYDQRRVYAGTVDGVMRSDDCGRTWYAAGMQGKIVKSLAVNRHDPDVVYAGTKPALMYISEDGGRSWSELDAFRRIPNRWWWFSPAEPPDRRPYVFAIAPSPRDADVLLAGIEFGAVVRSEDGGRSWSRHRSGALRDCHSLKFHETNGDWVYEAGGSGGGAAFSRDGGVRFHKAKGGLAKNYGIVCAADPVKPEVWYVCVGSSPFNAFGDSPQIYLYRRTGGADWQPIGWQPHPLGQTPTALATMSGRGGELYAGLKNGDVWHSADYGESWQQLPVNVGGVWFALLAVDEGA